MPLIGVVALVGVALVFDRVYVLILQGRPNGRSLIERVIQLVRSARVDEAIKLCTRSSSALPDIGLLILRSHTGDATDLQHVAAAASLSIVPRLNRRLEYIRACANTAFLIGLLGLVVGLERALGVSNGSGTGSFIDPVLAGASIALHPFAFGLTVATLLWAAHAYLSSRARSVAEQIDEFSVRLIDSLNDRPDIRLGHR